MATYSIKIDPPIGAMRHLHLQTWEDAMPQRPIVEGFTLRGSGSFVGTPDGYVLPDTVGRAIYEWDAELAADFAALNAEWRTVYAEFHRREKELLARAKRIPEPARPKRGRR